MQVVLRSARRGAALSPVSQYVDLQLSLTKSLRCLASVVLTAPWIRPASGLEIAPLPTLPKVGLDIARLTPEASSGKRRDR